MKIKNLCIIHIKLKSLPSIYHLCCFNLKSKYEINKNIQIPKKNVKTLLQRVIKLHIEFNNIHDDLQTCISPSSQAV